MKKLTVNEISTPSDSSISQIYESMDLSDAFMIHLTEDAIPNPEVLARFLFSQQALWVSGLMKFRDIFASAFGLRTTTRKLKKMSMFDGAGRIHYFKIYSSNDKEVILGEDDSHLDFRISILYRKPEETIDNMPYLIFSTVVNCHNKPGRVYLSVIAPFHRMVVRSGLRRALKAGWPK